MAVAEQAPITDHREFAEGSSCRLPRDWTEPPGLAGRRIMTSSGFQKDNICT